jgi:ribose-phosphate pyrophosphokinase
MDSDRRTAVNLSDFGCFSMPGGERHFELTETALQTIYKDTSKMRAVIRNSDHLMDLALATQWCHRNNVMPSSLVIPYVPYARQDRWTTMNAPFSLKIATAFINSLGYESVSIYEPHSDVTPGLIDRCGVRGCEEACDAAVREILGKDGSKPYMDRLRLVAPDAGAAKRVDRCLHYLKTKTPGWVAESVEDTAVQVLKHRDPATGRLHITDICGLGLQGYNQNFLIVDDICDGGATFVELAKALCAVGARSVHLFVAHGIFSKGHQPLAEAGIDSVHYTDSLSECSLVNSYQYGHTVERGMSIFIHRSGL